MIQIRVDRSSSSSRGGRSLWTKHRSEDRTTSCLWTIQWRTGEATLWTAGDDFLGFDRSTDLSTLVPRSIPRSSPRPSAQNSQGCPQVGTEPDGPLGGLGRAERPATSAEHRTPSTERRATSNEQRATSNEQRATSNERRAPNAERRTPCTERRATRSWREVERLRARQPTTRSRNTSAGRGLGAAQRGCGGRAPLTLGGKIESASAGPGERTGDGPFPSSHLLFWPDDVAAPRRAVAERRREHRAPSTEHGAPSTEHRAPSTEQRATSNEQRATSNERRNNEHRTPSTEQRAPNAEHRATSTSTERRATRSWREVERLRARQPTSPITKHLRGSGSGRSPVGVWGQSPLDPGREDRVSVGRAGGANRRRALPSVTPPLPALLRRHALSRGSSRERAEDTVCSARFAPGTEPGAGPPQEVPAEPSERSASGHSQRHTSASDLSTSPCPVTRQPQRTSRGGNCSSRFAPGTEGAAPPPEVPIGPSGRPASGASQRHTSASGLSTSPRPVARQPRERAEDAVCSSPFAPGTELSAGPPPKVPAGPSERPASGPSQRHTSSSGPATSPRPVARQPQRTSRGGVCSSRFAPGTEGAAPPPEVPIGPRERPAGVGPFQASHLRFRPCYVATPRRAAAQTTSRGGRLSEAGCRPDRAGATLRRAGRRFALPTRPARTRAPRYQSRGLCPAPRWAAPRPRPADRVSSSGCLAAARAGPPRRARNVVLRQLRTWSPCSISRTL
jgi:hypothetical protein